MKTMDGDTSSEKVSDEAEDLVGSVLSRAVAFMHLADYESTQREIDSLSEPQRTIVDVLWLQFDLAQALGKFDEAAKIAEDLDRRGIRQLGWFVPYGVGTLGNNPQRAHNITLEQERRERHGSLYWFNRACYASFKGRALPATPQRRVRDGRRLV